MVSRQRTNMLFECFSFEFLSSPSIYLFIGRSVVFSPHFQILFLFICYSLARLRYSFYGMVFVLNSTKHTIDNGRSNILLCVSSVVCPLSHSNEIFASSLFMNSKTKRLFYPSHSIRLLCANGYFSLFFFFSYTETKLHP